MRRMIGYVLHCESEGTFLTHSFCVEKPIPTCENDNWKYVPCYERLINDNSVIFIPVAISQDEIQSISLKEHEYIEVLEYLREEPANKNEHWEACHKAADFIETYMLKR